MTVIVDYGAGNIRSVVRAFERLGEVATVSSDPDVVGRARRLILPGVGSFDAAMIGMQRSQLLPVLEEKSAKKVCRFSEFVWGFKFSRVVVKKELCPAWDGFQGRHESFHRRRSRERFLTSAGTTSWFGDRHFSSTICPRIRRFISCTLITYPVIGTRILWPRVTTGVRLSRRPCWTTSWVCSSIRKKALISGSRYSSTF